MTSHDSPHGYEVLLLVIFHLLELWPVQEFSAEYVTAELGEYSTLKIEVRFKCVCYNILLALGSCR